MTPWEVVLGSYVFPEKIGPIPFVPEKLQIGAINELAPLPEAGHWLDMGTGKTFVATACALYQAVTFGSPAIVVLPPFLIRQWVRWLQLIRRVERHPKFGHELGVTAYMGTPAQRLKLDLEVDFIVVGAQVFRIDIQRFLTLFNGRKLTAIADEATFLGNINSQIHQVFYDFTMGQYKMLLTGTPANTPMDAYAMIKFTAPGVYKSRRQFENLHVKEYDFYNKPKTWQDLEQLGDNLMINSKRILYKDMYGDLQTPLYDHVEYDLEPAHLKLYKKLANDEMLKLDDGGKIDASKVARLRHALGQIVVNWGHFSQDPKNVSQGIEMIESTLSELGKGSKVVVFAHYKMSVALVVDKLQKYGAVGINSAYSDKEKDANLQRFVNDEKCRVIVIQYVSGGKGLDGMQHVCHTAICLEPCLQPRDFHQAVARLNRRGQRKRVHVKMAVARRTLQVDGFKKLLSNDTILNEVVRNAVDLHEEIHGKPANARKDQP